MLLLDAAAAVREARRRTGTVLSRWRCARERVADAVLVVSEIVTNAVQHGGGVTIVRLVRRRSHVRVEVLDNSSRSPELLPFPGVAEERGRGLTIVRALASRWGSVRTGSGNLVWAELPAGVDFGIDELTSDRVAG